MPKREANVTVTHSSHPEYLYFVDVRINGRQLARRFNDKEECGAFLIETAQRLQDNRIAVAFSDPEGVF